MPDLSRAWQRLALAAGALMALATTPALAQNPVAPRLACEALAGTDLSAELGVAARVDTAAVRREGHPAPVCHLAGTLRGSIGFEAWLPLERWTGRYLQVGCGGLCGRISGPNPPQAHGCLPVARGEFAIATTDMGHRDPSAASWGGDPERRRDFADRAQHLTALAAKALIARFYGEAPRRSYFSGCSDGGREGLLAALRHPEDFDGIAAGAPALDFTIQNTVHHAWTVQRNRCEDGSAILTADRLPVLHRAVLAACGSDGVVADPLRCGFDPLRAVCAPGADPATCLTAEEARVAAALYDGPRDAAGRRLSAGGMLPGSEANWRGTIAPENAATPPRALLFSTGVLGHLAFPPGAAAPAPQALAFDEATLARLADSQAVFDATATDLGPFLKRGGRLLVWHGLADQDITPRSTLAWWHALRRDQGAAAVDGSARLFLIPGLAHCRGGQGGLTEVDTLTPLLRWVEEGVAPDSLADGRIRPTGDVTVEPFLGDGRFGPRR
ncbi:tannase/feruloyl esterase family alpha/beta hydrolase [Roseomonas mucosa]|uniref:tannase/feruloyl esterase family alpha/beta hydrolase n=1 Tax=Roseomonas mucosa TaxID=207340 RepID=UPI00384F9B50